MKETLFALASKYGIPAIGLLCVLGAVICIGWLIVRDRKKTKTTKAITGFVYLHPENGGGHKLRLNDKELQRPSTPPFWYKQGLMSKEVPFYFFYEEKVNPQTKIPEASCKCICGYEGTNQQLHAHTMWNPKRKIDGKAVAKDEWDAKHKPITLVNKSVDITKFNIVPYDVDAAIAKNPPVITPFEIFNMNDWHEYYELCESLKEKKWTDAIKAGAWAVVAVACLIVAFALVSDSGKGTGTTQVNIPRLEQNK